MADEERALLIAVGQALYTLLYQLRAVERVDTQKALYYALAGVGVEPMES